MARLADLPVDVHRLIAFYVDDEVPFRTEFHIIKLMRVDKYWEDLVRHFLLTRGKMHYSQFWGKAKYRPTPRAEGWDTLADDDQPLTTTAARSRTTVLAQREPKPRVKKRDSSYHRVSLEQHGTDTRLHSETTPAPARQGGDRRL